MTSRNAVEPSLSLEWIMTTVCYRDGVLASDSLGCQGTFYGGSFQKIYQFNGFSVGVSGRMDEGTKFIKWLEHFNPFRPKRPPDRFNFTDMQALLIDSENNIWYYHNHGHPVKVKDAFFAIGSGRYAAMPAMEAGASAKDAVKIAMKYDTQTGGDIQIISCSK